jgi:hypothetical protein
MAVIGSDGTVLRTMECPVPANAGAHPVPAKASAARPAINRGPRADLSPHQSGSRTSSSTPPRAVPDPL